MKSVPDPDGRIRLTSIVPRFPMWWRHLVPPMFAFAFLSVLVAELPLVAALQRLGCFTVTIIATAAFGYFLNDWTDIEQDRMARKPNQVANLRTEQRIAIAAALLVASWAPWIFLPRNGVNIPFMVLQYAAYLCYSCRPLRLKDRKHWGLVCDMLYGHLIPVVVTCATFLGASTLSASQWIPFFAALGIWLAAKGIRNILLHQVSDRAADRQASVDTFVRRVGPLRTIKTTTAVVLPLELPAFAIVLGLLARHRAPVYIGFLTFMAFTCVKFSVWKLPFLPARQSWFKFLYFLNDFYEEWFTLTVLAIICWTHPSALPLLCIYLCLFPWLLRKLARDCVVVRDNLRAVWEV